MMICDAAGPAQRIALLMIPFEIVALKKREADEGFVTLLDGHKVEAGLERGRPR